MGMQLAMHIGGLKQADSKPFWLTRLFLRMPNYIRQPRQWKQAGTCTECGDFLEEVSFGWIHFGFGLSLVR
jgi:hypothetical protein